MTELFDTRAATSNLTRIEHSPFIVGLGFVAGFIDVFGFLTFNGLLAAHVTGNVVFLAIDLAIGRDPIFMKIAALPIFCAAVVMSAWFIGSLMERKRNPMVPALALQAGLIVACMACVLLIPAGGLPNDPAVLAGSVLALIAMALHNTFMRLVLNDLPPTTVLTGNITHVLSHTAALMFGLPSIRHSDIRSHGLGQQAQRMLLTILSFVAGTIAAAFGTRWLGAAALLMPIAALLALIPFSREATRSAQKQG